jgi:predicted alpha-1,2-mannosidase
MKGIRNFDAKTALEAMVKTTNAQGSESSVGRNGFEAYNRLGYVPYPDFNEATAKTLEYAYADWCISRFAGEQKDLVTQKRYAQQAMNYKNLLDTTSGFMRSKNKEGKWNEPFDPIEWGGPFTEGSSWHYTWSVMHDPDGLAKMMGGRNRMGDKLDAMFAATTDFKVGTYGYVIHEMAEMKALNMGQYGHGNQPVQHAIYLYNYAQQPWKGQFHLREVMTKLYNSTPKGYCGDEDNGQTSAWYVFSAMGFYPVCPGQPDYIMGSPLFKQVKLNLSNGKTFVINAPANNTKNVYIQSATLNGADFTKSFIKHTEITAGGVLNFNMTDQPNVKRGIKETDLPYSFSRTK